MSLSTATETIVVCGELAAIALKVKPGNGNSQKICAELIASKIGPWINLIENNLPPLSCVLSMTDSTTTNGWLRKTNFADDNGTKDASHLACKLDLARAHATCLTK